MSLVENYGPMLPPGEALGQELEEGLPEFEMELEDIMVEGLSPDDMAFMAAMQEEVAVEIEIPHFANLAEYLGDDELSDIAERVIEGFEADKDSRSEWDETLTRGLDLLGLKFEETGTAFDGSCAATHPLIIESAVKFQSKASQEILPANGPVRTQIIGDPDSQIVQQSNRVRRFMNYELTEMMPEYFDEMERMLFHLPIVGSAIVKMYYDGGLERPTAEHIPIDQFYVNYSATDLRRADRYTHIIYKSPVDIRRDIAAGMYRDVEDLSDSPDSGRSDNEISSKIDEIMGLSGNNSEDPEYTLLEQHVYLELEDDDMPYPYIVTVEESSRQVLSLRRNYREDDPRAEKMIHFTHYRFVPGFGFYGLGLIHLIGNLTMTATSAMRALIDAGQFANLPGGFKAKGVRVVGDNDPISPGEFKEIEALGMDLNKAIVNLPYKEP
ncbi:MAG: portal protein, partial [Ilumatobacteraceae bacterium]